ncbi:prepilin-type N-terminal cleavage/methylation domain-containing protein [Kosakonia sp. BYX6]|uniref:Prepilin-type N-terminal cleavage/methylation domain-containing protein n=1 Tax=Kosakonia calanthes TaxID=3139408 RepID=A0ABZ3BA77_9ENTR
MTPAHITGSQSGLTLIEVMIAIVIMAIINLMAWRGIDVLSRANTTLQLHSEEDSRLVRALQQLDRDIAWHTTVELPPRTSVGEHLQPGDLLPAGMQITEFASGQLRMTIVRAAPAAPGQWQQVQWWLQGGTLWRAAGLPSAQYPLPAPRVNARVAVLDGVASFNLRVWIPSRGWQTLPRPRQSPSAATGLEISLAVRRNAGPAQPYRRVLVFN